MYYVLLLCIPQTTNLRPPYGTCGDSPLDSFDPGTIYSRSRCAHQCSARMAVRHCGCKDAYMPGKCGKLQSINHVKT